MLGLSLTPVASDRALPNAVDMVSIGGGIIGTSAALTLAERGHKVLLCEKGEIAGEQSSRNRGWVRLYLCDLREIPLMIEAIRLWTGMDPASVAPSDIARRASSSRWKRIAITPSIPDGPSIFAGIGSHVTSSRAINSTGSCRVAKPLLAPRSIRPLTAGPNRNGPPQKSPKGHERPGLKR